VLVSLALVIVVIITAGFTGGFEWKMKTITERVEEAGTFNPDDILGRHTFIDVSDSTGIKKNCFSNSSISLRRTSRNQSKTLFTGKAPVSIPRLFGNSSGKN
jgi:hypothetical protein